MFFIKNRVIVATHPYIHTLVNEINKVGNNHFQKEISKDWNETWYKTSKKWKSTESTMFLKTRLVLCAS
jgi:hypothetical protein